MPCMDGDDCKEEKLEQNALIQHEEETSEELCSPFCICSCCSTPLLINIAQIFQNHISAKNTLYSVPIIPKICAAIIPIWQPPELV